MSKNQSSQNLQNYISSGYQDEDSSHLHQQQSSACIDCQKITKIQNYQSSQTSSSGDNGQLVQPLHRHIVQHSRQIQSTILHLKSQIQKLKKANQSKDILIQDLQRQLKQVHKSRILIKDQNLDDLKVTQFLRRQRQVEKIRKQLIQNSQKVIHLQKISSQQNNQSSDSSREINQMKKRLKSIEVKFQDKTARQMMKNEKQIIRTKKVQISSLQNSDSDSSSQDEDRTSALKQKKLPHLQKQNTQKQKHIKKSKVKNNNIINDLRNGQLNTDVMVNEQMKSYLQKISRLESHIQFCEQQMLWMTNFIISFLKMTDKFMIFFKQPLIRQHWTMKKKTKVAWRYVKHLLEWFVGTG